MGAVAQGFTILIVEDHAVIAAEIADGIQRNGGQVLGPASCLPEALALIETTPCDAALLDVNLGHEAVYPAAEKL
jgi:DNA-binding NarL/FixJ family response regulator